MAFAQTMFAKPFLGRAVARAPTAAGRTAVRAPVVVRAEREMWYPGAKAPKHLDGSMAGDFGFDPLRIGANPDLLPYYKQAELTNGRWAMMAVAGILFTDAFGIGPWWEAGTKEYALPTSTLVAVEVVVFAILEGKRIEGWKKTGESGVLSMFPFDPMGMSSDEMKLKEVKNGRTAMLAFLGMSSQAAVTGKGPIECLTTHIADPIHNNIYTSSVGVEFSAAVVALACWPTIVELYKGLAGEDKDEEFRPIPW
mmetsp:Transcript_5294/g.14761  ORF Transcript_5294/g.14761 Transcript_5294/m.14761 type:complete len:253 (-) Transcript_5294:118-876(-)|eukprot:CAMPEP_0117671650 /NCGR_PEP_ID=MMETSP0804-20121206/13458_1 /TAXON_ID=1074897 /ORGANISM="Tetraselmis astigmatica, Strain CCMP880" /LENGTH=252 /DNA_ID=CAMNT_0005480147 /DNA_START=89 /DNA_END=847 /DNA_ORIENTATION=-